MNMTTVDIEYLEGLAKLELSDAERETLQPRIDEMLEYFNSLKELELDGVAPMSHCLELKSILREDEPSSSLSVDEALKNAKESEGGCFVAPKSI